MENPLGLAMNHRILWHSIVIVSYKVTNVLLENGLQEILWRMEYSTIVRYDSLVCSAKNQPIGSHLPSFQIQRNGDLYGFFSKELVAKASLDITSIAAWFCT
jgi:hypothetical protein